ncbi:hypothetical protein [Trichormus variabilis]|nr:hypothetical protein [Trichormus variabilis]
MPKLYHPKVTAAIEIFATNYFCCAELDAQLAIDYCEAIDELLLTRNADFFPYCGICLTQLVRDINNLIPPMDIALNNSNNNKIHHKFLVGREGIVSPVLYLRIAKHYIINQNWNKLEYNLTVLATEKYGCDEYGVTENTDSSFQYRFWWDYSKI